mgnify:CR=1 FL=1
MAVQEYRSAREPGRGERRVRNGYDAIVIQGQSKTWKYLYIQDDVIELRDATGLVGKDTWQTQAALSERTGLRAALFWRHTSPPRPPD